MVAAACTGIVEAPDEGSGSSTGVAICSSNVYWKDMDKGSEFMHPGGKCNTCHDKNPMTAPNLTIAGTVYPTSHEPDECNGVTPSLNDAGAPEITIVITDKSGRTLPPLPVNSVGNFKFEAEVLKPFNVKVVPGKRTNDDAGAPRGLQPLPLPERRPERAGAHRRASRSGSRNHFRARGGARRRARFEELARGQIAAIEDGLPGW
jgi:hypothetical protein